MTSAYDTGRGSRRLPGAVLDLEGRAGTPVSLPREVGRASPSPCGGAYRACVSAAWHNRMSPAWSCRPLYAGTPSLPGRPRGRYSNALTHNAHPSTDTHALRGRWRGARCVVIFGYGVQRSPGHIELQPRGQESPPPPPTPTPRPEGPGSGLLSVFNGGFNGGFESGCKNGFRSDCKSGDYSTTIP